MFELPVRELPAVAGDYTALSISGPYIDDAGGADRLHDGGGLAKIEGEIAGIKAAIAEMKGDG